MTRTRFRKIIIAAGAIIALAGGVALGLWRLDAWIHSPAFKTWLDGLLTEKLGMGITYTGLDHDLLRLAAVVEHPVVAVPGQYSLRATRVAVRFAPLSAIAGGSPIASLAVEDPDFILNLDGFPDDGKPKKDMTLPHFEALRGAVTIVTGGRTIELRGDWEGRLTVARTRGAMSFRGKLMAHQAMLTVNGRPFAVRGTVRFLGTAAETDDLTLAGSDMSLAYNGTVALRNPAAVQGTLTVTGLRIDVRGGGGGDMGSVLQAVTGQVDLRMANLVLMGVAIPLCTAQASVDGGRLFLKNIAASGTGITAGGYAVVGPAGLIDFSLSFAVHGGNVSDIMYAVSPSTLWSGGTVWFQGDLRGSGGMINGEFAFMAAQGRIMRNPLLVRILGFLNLSKLLVKGGDSLAGDGVPYTTIVGRFDIKDSVAKFSDFYFDSNSIKISAVGEYAFKTNRIDALVGIRPLETVDRIINLIPLLGWILTGKDGGFLVMYVNVIGDMSDPAVRAAALDSVSRPVAGIIMRTLTLPITVFTKPQVLVPGGR